MSVLSPDSKLTSTADEAGSRENRDRPAWTRVPPLTFAAFGVALALLVAVYWGTVTWWYDEWTREGSFYAHGIFIPFFVAIMVWRDRERLKRLPASHAWWGLGLIVLAIAVVLLSEKAQVTIPKSISFILFLIGATLVVAGKQITRALLFPLLFLSTMIPLVPDQLINPIAFPIQLISAKMAAALCTLVGFPSTLNATHVSLPNFDMNVELPCSGFKTLLGLLSFSAAFAYVVEGEKWKRWLLFFIAGPLAIVINGLRITLIGLVGELFGGAAARTFHDYSGFIVLILGFTFLFNLARVLRCDNFLGVPLTDGPADRPAPTSGSDEKGGTAASRDERERETRAALDARWGPPHRVNWQSVTVGLIPIIVLLAAAAGALPAIKAPSTSIPAVASSDIPTKFSEGAASWEAFSMPAAQGGTTCDIPITPEVKSALNPISYVNRRYDGGPARSGSVDFLLTAGNGRKVFHDPHTCFLGSGYFMHDVRLETIDTPAGPLKVQVAEAEKQADHSRTLVMFCYLIDGKQLQTTQQLNTALMWQLLFGDSGQPSYFLRFTQMNTGTDATRQEELRTFIRSIWTSIARKAAGKARTQLAAR